jgi:hypothetical protein
MARIYTGLEIEMAEAINNLAIALDRLSDAEHKKVANERKLAITILNKNHMLTDHPDWHGRVVVKITEQVSSKSNLQNKPRIVDNG